MSNPNPLRVTAGSALTQLLRSRCVAAHKIIDTRGVELIQDAIASTVLRIQQNGLNQFNLLMEAGSVPEAGPNKPKGGAGGEHLRNMLLGIQHASRQQKGHARANKNKSKKGTILISLVRILLRGRSPVLRAKAAVGLRAVFACKRSMLHFAFQELKLLSVVDRVVSHMDVTGMATQPGVPSANAGSKDDERYMRVNVTALMRQLLACGASVLRDTEGVLSTGGAAPKSHQAAVLAEAVKDFEIVLFLLSSAYLRLPLLQATNAISAVSRCLELTDQVLVPRRAHLQQALLLTLEAAVQHPEVLDCCWADVVMDMMPALARNFANLAANPSATSKDAAEQLHVLALKLYVDVMSYYVLEEGQDDDKSTLATRSPTASGHTSGTTTDSLAALRADAGASGDDTHPRKARQALLATLFHTTQELVLPHSRALLSAREPIPHYVLKLVSVLLCCDSTGSGLESALVHLLPLMEPIVSLLQSRTHAFHGNPAVTS